MATNGRGNMRPTGRSPPFLAIGLFVALIILGFNYWSLSARNGEQSNEIILMESELRLVNAKKTSAEKRSEAISDKVSDLEKQLNQQKEIIANNAAELANVEREKETFTNRVNELEIEVRGVRDQQLPSCEAEKANVETEVQELKDMVETYRKKQCTESDCTQFIRQSRDATLEDVYKVAGADALISMYRNNNDLGSYKGQIAGLAARMEKAAAQGHVQQQQQADSQQQQQKANLQQQQQPDQRQQQLDGQQQQPDLLQQQQQQPDLQLQQQPDLQQQQQQQQPYGQQQQPGAQQQDQQQIDSLQPLVPDAQVVPAPGGADAQNVADATNQNVDTNLDNTDQDPTRVDAVNVADQVGTDGGTDIGNDAADADDNGDDNDAAPKTYDDDDDDEEDDAVAQDDDDDDDDTQVDDYDFEAMDTAGDDKPDDYEYDKNPRDLSDPRELPKEENGIKEMFQSNREVQDRVPL